MLMCLFSIRGHKGLGFCQVRTEVIPIFLFVSFFPLLSVLLFQLTEQKNHNINIPLKPTPLIELERRWR